MIEVTIPTTGRVSDWAYWGVLLDAELVLDFLGMVGVYSAGMLGVLRFDASLIGHRHLPLPVGLVAAGDALARES